MNIDWPRFMTWAGAIIFCLLFWSVIAICVVGCGGRSQVQDLADAGAGAKAYQQEPDPEKRAIIAKGLVLHLLAALDSYPLLPKATMAPAEIRSDPMAYVAAGEQAEADPQPYRTEDHPAPDPPLPNPLREVGTTAMRWGAIVSIVGAAVWLVGLTGWLGAGLIGRIIASQVVSGLARLGLSLGVCGIGSGAAMVWIATYLWWIVAGLAVGAAAFHWKDLRSVWRRVLRRKGT